ncbi:MAG: 50S ribosomal protein L3 N(5)-glutamine methyltransferase [Gammaproteobacteria bacterium]|nr:50S ribosomal protein L3 N(5)-glutamine methyltransferase [Gammaproteobacteria bacterium]
MTDKHALSKDTVNLGQAILAGEDYLKQFDLSYFHGTDNARDESAWLCIHAVGLSPIEAVDYDLVLTADELANIHMLLEKRAHTKQPAAYLTGTAYFCGLPFKVDPRVLIPRSPIGALIVDGFSDWFDKEPANVLDLCTGSGCIGIACAYAFEAANVVLSDYSEDALEVAVENIAMHSLAQRVTAVASDLFDQLPDRQFDLIVTNPPYVDQEDMEALTAEFEHEPEMALAAGDDGLLLVHRILKEAKRYLLPNGVLVCEVGNSADALTAAYPELPFEWLQFGDGVGGVFVLRHHQLPD